MRGREGRKRKGEEGKGENGKVKEETKKNSKVDLFVALLSG